jgi:hypothetical protein
MPNNRSIVVYIDRFFGQEIRMNHRVKKKQKMTKDNSTSLHSCGFLGFCFLIWDLAFHGSHLCDSRLAYLRTSGNHRLLNIYKLCKT